MCILKNLASWLKLNFGWFLFDIESELIMLSISKDTLNYPAWLIKWHILVVYKLISGLLFSAINPNQLFFPGEMDENMDIRALLNSPVTGVMHGLS